MSLNQMPVIGIVERTRKSPFFDATVRWGVKGFTVYNHMLMPIFYDSPEADYWHLVTNVTLWDVAVERQVEITGADAFKLARLMTPRDLRRCKIGQCKYVPICRGQEHGALPTVANNAENGPHPLNPPQKRIPRSKPTLGEGEDLVKPEQKSEIFVRKKSPAAKGKLGEGLGVRAEAIEMSNSR